MNNTITIERIKSLPGILFARQVAYQLRMRVETLKLGETAPAPDLLMLETSSLCNLKCAKCHHNSSSRSHGLMETGLALDVIDRASSMGIKTICLSMLGEPLMHPELELIVERTADRGMTVYLVTNATLLTPEQSKILIESGINRLCVSIDGWDSISYGKRHGGTDIESVFDNLSAFHTIREKSANHPVLVSTTVLDSHSLKRLRELKKFIAPHVDANILNPLTDFGIPGQELEPELLPGKRSWRRMPCPYFWSSMNIGWDGQVTACCNDHNYMLTYHHVNDAPLEKIWQSETIRKFRRLHLAREFDKMPMCGNCTRDWVNSLAFQRISHKFNSMRV